jgi:hypothetical protein
LTLTRAWRFGCIASAAEQRLAARGADMSTGVNLTSDPLCTYAFILLSYAMACGCLIHIVRDGLARSKKKGGPPAWNAVGSQFLLFAFLVFGMLLVESYAHHRSPYYVYSSRFWDRVGYVPLGFLPANPLPNRCTELVRSLGDEANGGIPVSVFLLEASLAFAAARTARMLSNKLIFEPFLAGLALFALDSFLDPVVATYHDGCDALREPTGHGLGFWVWFLPKGGDFPDLAYANELATWFGVPVFNFAAWLGAPLIIISIAHLFGPFVRYFAWPKLTAKEPSSETGSVSPFDNPTGKRLRAPPANDHLEKSLQKMDGSAGMLLLVVIVTGLVLVSVAPGSNPSPGMQWHVTSAGAVFVAFLLFRQAKDFQTAAKTALALVFPAAATLAVWAIVAAYRTQFMTDPWLMPVGAILLPLGLWLTWLPYGEALERFVNRVQSIERSLRAHYFGFTAMLLFMGAAMAAPKYTNVPMAELALLAVCFHCFSYVLRDLVGANRPSDDAHILESGMLKAKHAKVLVPVAGLGAIASVMWAVPPWHHALPLATLVVALLLTIGYNALKKSHLWMANGLFALAWGSLAILGATIVKGGQPELPDAIRHSWALFTYAVLFVLLIHAFHAGFRGKAVSPAMGTQLGWVTFIIHVAMLATLAGYMRLNKDEHPHWGVLAAVAAIFLVLDASMLYRLVQTKVQKDGVFREEDEEYAKELYVVAHAFAAMLPPLLVFLFAKGPDATLKLTVFCALAAPLLLWEPVFANVVGFVYLGRKPVDGHYEECPDAPVEPNARRRSRRPAAMGM